MREKKKKGSGVTGVTLPLLRRTLLFSTSTPSASVVNLFAELAAARTEASPGESSRKRPGIKGALVSSAYR